MFSPDITVGSNVYSKVSTEGNSSFYRDATVVAPEERELRISHDTTKNGRVNTVAIFSRKVPITGAYDANGKQKFAYFVAHEKVSYDNDTGLDVDSIINEMRDQSQEFNAVLANRVKLSNGEH